MNSNSLTAERLRSLLSYDAETGVFVWLVSTNGRIKVGDIAGNLDSNGYMHIGCDGKTYKAHRLAWLWKRGAWPKDQIDHRDGDKTNNRWANLREATNAVNQQNKRHARRDNKSTGLIGAKLHRKTGKFMASINVNKQRIYLGLHDTAVLAHNAYIKAKRELHPGCTL
jgi:hypothetical protein